MQPTSPRRPRKHTWPGVSWAGPLARFLLEGILGVIGYICPRGEGDTIGGGLEPGTGIIYVPDLGFTNLLPGRGVGPGTRNRDHICLRFQVCTPPPG